MFAIIAIAADDPEAMPFSGMVSLFPLCGNHRSVPNLDNQIAYGEPGLFSHSHEVTVGPF